MTTGAGVWPGWVRGVSVCTARGSPVRRGDRSRHASGSVLPTYLLVPARCVPVNVYWMVDDWFWKEFGAADGKDSVTRR